MITKTINSKPTSLFNNKKGSTFVQFLTQNYMMMKKNILFLCFFIASIGNSYAQATTDFVTTWDTRRGGNNNPNRLQILIPIAGRFDIDTNNDGIFDLIDRRGSRNNIIPVTFPSEGIYTIRIRPNPTHNPNKRLRIDFGALDAHIGHVGSRAKLTNIHQWGDIVWTSMANAFLGCFRLTIENSAGVPNLTMVTDMHDMFNGTEHLRGGDDMNDWDVSRVTDMSNMFKGTSSFFNSNIGSWDVRKVTNMNGMFTGATKFNQNIREWIPQKVTSAANMFTGVTAFSDTHYDQLLTSWIAHGTHNNVTFGAPPAAYSTGGKAARIRFTSERNWTITGDEGIKNTFISTWNPQTRGSSNKSILLPIAGSFDIDVNNDGDFDDAVDLLDRQGSRHNPIRVTFTTAGQKTIRIRPHPDRNTRGHLRIDFGAISSIEAERLIAINKWGDVTWTTMTNAFVNCNRMNIATDAGVPDLSIVTNMSRMFHGAGRLNSNTLSGWDVSRVTDMAKAFEGARVFNQDIGGWNTSNVTAMQNMFRGAQDFNNAGQDFNWDVTKVIHMNFMFNGALKFNRDLRHWNPRVLQEATHMFTNAPAFSSDNYSRLLSSWSGRRTLRRDVPFGAPPTTYSISGRNGKTILSSDDPTNGKDWHITGDKGLTNVFITTWNTQGGQQGSTSIKIPMVSSSSVSRYDIDTNNDGTFDLTGQDGTTTINYGTVKTSVTIRIRPSPNSNLSKGDRLAIRFGNLTHSDSNFRNNLISIDSWGDISWASMEQAFIACRGMDIADNAGAPDLSIVQNFRSMFHTATNLNTSNLDNWDVSNVRDMMNMFQGATNFNGNISNWDVSKVHNMNRTFQHAQNFNSDISRWDVSKVTDMERMFYNAKKFNQNIGGWTIPIVRRMTEMFGGDVPMGGTSYSSDFSAENYDLLLQGWSSQPVIKGVVFRAPPTTYTAVTEKVKLIIEYGWVFSGDQGTVNNPFIISFDPGTTGSFKVPISEGRYDIDVDNNGTYDMFYKNGTTTINATSPTTIRIRPNPGNQRNSFRVDFGSQNASEAAKLTSIVKWGSIIWHAEARNAYKGCTNMNIADGAGVPNLSRVVDAWQMFLGATSLNADLSGWDVSGITNMEAMFFNATSFNGNVSNWNTSNANNMFRMFRGATNFNGNISGWDTSSVTRMDGMFYDATSFNQNIGGWDISRVEHMNGMLSGTTLFTNFPYTSDFSTENYDALLTGWSMLTPRRGVNFGGPPVTYCTANSARSTLIATHAWTITGDGGLSPGCSNYFVTTWNTEGVGTPDQSGSTEIIIPMEGGKYDIDINNDGTFEHMNKAGLQTINLGSAGTHTIAIRPNATSNPGNQLRLDFFNVLDNTNHQRQSRSKLTRIDNWGDVTWPTMEDAFRGCRGLGTIADDAGMPDISIATSLQSMFHGAINLNSDLNHWNVSNIVNMRHVFNGASSFNGNISDWDVSSVEDMASMFKNATSFNGSINDWNVREVANMNAMFEGASGFNKSVHEWIPEDVTSAERMFTGATGFSPDNYSRLLTGWAGHRLQGDVVFGAPPTTYSISGRNGKAILSSDHPTDGKDWHITGDKGLTNVFVTTWNTQGGQGGSTRIKIPMVSTTTSRYDIDTNNDGTFDLTGQDGTTTINYGTAKEVTIRIRPSPNSDLNKGDQLSIRFGNLIDGNSAFRNNLIMINSWGDIAWKSMEQSFIGCDNMDIADDAGAPDLSLVQNVRSMFHSAITLNTSNLDNWDVSNVRDMMNMFQGATNFNGNISNWDVSRVHNMNRTFQGAENFNSDISSWNVSAVTDMDRMFYNAEKFNQNIGGWTIPIVRRMTEMFGGTSPYSSDFSPENYDLLLQGWSSQPVIREVVFRAPPTTYSAAGRIARAVLTSAPYNWIITGDEGLTRAFVTTWDTRLGNGQGGSRKILIPISSGNNYDVDTNNDGTFNLKNRDGRTEINFGAPGEYTIKIRPSPDSNGGGRLNINFGDLTGGNDPFRRKLTSIDSWGDILWTTMNQAFIGCENVTIANDAGAPNLSIVQNFRSMFHTATNLNAGDLSDWDVSNVRDMTNMFQGATNFNGNISNWNVSRVHSMNRTFQGAENFNSDISSWNVSAVTDMERMFYNAKKFNQNIGGWNIPIVRRMTNMFGGDVPTGETSYSSDFSSENYDALLLGWSALPSLWGGIGFTAPPTTYCSGASGRATLTEAVANSGWSWTISGDRGLGCQSFVTTWNTEAGTGQTGVRTIKIAITGGKYNVDIGNDGSFDLMNQMPNAQARTITFPTAGPNNTLAIIPHADNTAAQLRITLHGGGATPQKLTTINKWGSVAWTSMENAFRGCTNLNIDSNAGVPDLSMVENMSYMFDGATSLNQSLNDWDVSNISNMEGLFKGAIAFNGDVSNWDVSNVTNILSTFHNATNFNRNISGWNVSSVDIMETTFFNASAFTGDLSTWNVSNVTDMDTMFQGATSFNGNISTWNVSNVDSMAATFSNAMIFTGDLSSWDVSNVTNMTGTFFGATNFTSDLSSWNVSNVADIGNMFSGASSFNGNVSSWNVSSVVNMNNTFEQATAFNGNVSSWNVSSVTNMDNMFNQATAFDSNLNGWNVANLTTAGGMFRGASAFSSENYDELLTSWSILPSLQSGVNFGPPPTTYCSGAAGRNTLTSAPHLWVFGTGDSVDCPGAFVTTWNTGTIALSISGGSYDVDSNNDGVFDMVDQTGSLIVTPPGVAATNTIGIRPNTATNREKQLRILVEDPSSRARLVSIDKWGDIVWTSMANAFQGCSNLTGIASDAGNPDLSMVTDMSFMFHTARRFNADLSGWDVSNVTDMSQVFAIATAFNSDISGWNVSSATNMDRLFRGADSFNGNISGWDVSAVTDMQFMFLGAGDFNQDLGGWNVSAVTDMTNMLAETSLSRENYDALLEGWSLTVVLQLDVTLDVGDTKYCNTAARNALLFSVNWTINDGGEDTASNCNALPPTPPSIDVLYAGNGNSNNGIGLGSGSINFNDDGTTISCTFTKGSSDDSFDKVLVIYIDSKAGGVDSNSFSDVNTTLKEAIAGDALVSGGTRHISRVNFPSDFLADYAIAMSPVSGIESGALWEVRTAVSGVHTFIGTVNLSPNDNVSSDSYTFDFDFAEIGITSADSFKFIATVFDTSTGTRSDEAIGGGIVSGSGGIDRNIAFTESRTYPNTWTGATDTDWATGGNWSFDGSAPSTTHNVLIPKTANQPTAAAAVTVNKVVMAPGTSLIASSTFTGDITYHRNIDFVSGGKKGWYLMSSPVVGQTYNEAYVTANDIAQSTNPDTPNIRGIGSYASGSDTWVYFQSTDSDAVFASGRGYAIKKQTSTGAITFTGTLNTDDSGVDVSLFQSGGNRFHLLGNPYPSYLNSTTFLDNEAAISQEKTLWVWNQEITMYEAKNLVETLMIAPGQGFFVRVNTGSIPAINFSEANQSHSATDTFQKSAKTQVKLDITDGDNHKNYCKIYYSEETTSGFDVGYDGELFSGAPNPFAIYTHLVSDSEGKNYQIQSLPYSDIENMVIPIGINAVSGKEISISADVTNFPAGVHLYLEDKLKNSFTQLDKNGAKYTISLSDDLEGIGRFFLRASSSDLEVSSTSLENVSIYASSKNNLRIVGIQEGDVTLKAYNLLGVQIINTSFKGNGKNDVAIPSLAAGIYIVHLEMETGKVSKKVVVE